MLSSENKYEVLELHLVWRKKLLPDFFRGFWIESSLEMNRSTFYSKPKIGKLIFLRYLQRNFTCFHQLLANKKSQFCNRTGFVPKKGLEPPRPKAHAPEACTSTNFATSAFFDCLRTKSKSKETILWYRRRDSNPHTVANTGFWIQRVYRFRHSGGTKSWTDDRKSGFVNPFSFSGRQM